MRHLIRRVESGNIDRPKEILDDIAGSSLAASARLQRIIKAFEAFAGLDQAELKAVNINEAIETVLTLLDHEIGTRIEVIKHLGNVEPVISSPGRMHQALMNLLLNAIQSIDGKGEVQIRSEQLPGQVNVLIQDTGRGMTPDQLNRILMQGSPEKEIAWVPDWACWLRRRSFERPAEIFRSAARLGLVQLSPCRSESRARQPKILSVQNDHSSALWNDART